MTDLADILTREIAMQKEIEQQKTVIEAEQYLNHSLLASSGDCIQMLDVDGRLLYMNSTGCRLMEVEDCISLTGQSWPHSWPAEALQDAEAAIARARLGDAGRFQAFCPTYKGTPKWWDVQVTAITDDRGRAIKLLAISRDVTATKEAENQIRESEEHFRHMADHASVMLRLALLDARCAYFNRSWYEFTGQRPETALDFAWLDVVHPDDREALRAALHQASKDLTPCRLEYRLRRHDGSYRWVLDSRAPRFDAFGSCVGFISSVIDIHDRRLVEEALLESETRFRTLANNIAQLAWTADASGWIFWYNQRWFDYTGATLNEMQGWGWRAVHHPDHVDRVVAKISRCFQTGEVWEDTFPLRGRDGNYRWFLSRAFPIHDEQGRVAQWFGTNTDITEQLEAESALQVSEAQLRLVTDHTSVFLLQCDRSHHFKFVNRPYAQRFGLEPQQVIGRHVADIVGAEAYALLQPHMETVLAGQRVEFEVELPYEQLGLCWMNEVYEPEWGPDGDVIGFVAIIADISLRKRAEAALRESEERLKLALAGADMGVWTWELDTGAVYWSPEIYGLFGTETFDGTLEAFVQFLHPEDADLVWNALDTALANQTLYSSEFRIVRPDGSVRWMANRGRADYAADGKPMRMLGVVLDITDRRLAEQEVERARDEALAASRAKDDFLAALSHELRTPLNPVLLLASEAMKNPRLPSEVRADFETIAQNVALEARLIDDLLDLTRITRGKLVLSLHPIDVHTVLKDAVATVQAELEQKQLTLSLQFKAEKYIVLGDAIRLRQIFWNILNNAVKFTPLGGQINITTHSCADSHTLNVDVVDTGIGLSPEEIERVFSAFSQGDHALRGDPHRFGGVGLGLAIARTLVELHDGHISASSAGQGQGATFAITFPLLRTVVSHQTGEPTVAQTTAPSRAAAAGSSEQLGRILLIEDHQPTRKTLTRLLTRRHYEVTAASSCAEAQAFASQKRFDLVISDIGLPDGDGYTLMAELSQAQPGLTGIALSGYGMEGDLARSRHAGFAIHLIKPIQIGDLEQAIADLLPASSAVDLRL